MDTSLKNTTHDPVRERSLMLISRGELVERMRSGGITEDELIKVLREGLWAERSVQGMMEVDFKERRECAKLCLQLMGYLCGDRPNENPSDPLTIQILNLVEERKLKTVDEVDEVEDAETPDVNFVSGEAASRQKGLKVVQ